ncbi:uncharacterized protein HMPREF1541_05120 [Cyphellophora europaea CBS 101466]|uniref:Uncharacterized protein n=1 Tax=Cyphellophora europaea (strain CBS 101466) TaxID=1220924 RepID=W2RWY4_CYPE1|nr:uncharacterized protein HMPREF1541_05120 [Cyphellophora europaea CBS 101466]ETN40840.1 hypothetical protein HMPREF1541_05120 [Cyphellophora europaea CBS 101466]
MDPLSIACSALALAGVAAKIYDAISTLRRIGEVPGKVNVLKQDIKELEGLLRLVSGALNEQSCVPEASQEVLTDALAGAKGSLEKLGQALGRLTDACAGSRIKIISKTTIWIREETVFQRLREDVASVKGTLSNVLGTLSVKQQDVLLQGMREMLTWATKTQLENQVIDKLLAGNHLALNERLDRDQQAIASRIEALIALLTIQPLPLVQNTIPAQPSPLTEPVGNGHTRDIEPLHRAPCRSWCPCSCHMNRKRKFGSPMMVNGVLGRISMGYSGIPHLNTPCNFPACRGCRIRRPAVATLECWLPAWLATMNLKFHLTYLARSGPSFQLSTTRRVSDDSQSISFAMRGDIEGLRHLFAQGLAGPRDVSDSRGYTLMRWALYGGMHNFDTVRFLISEGATVDEASYDNVWDFVSRGKCTTPQQTALRCITEGGEGDWVEEQNFPLVHRIILGMSSKSLALELAENENAVHLTDAQHRTALDWATARSQLDDMVLLIKHGADPNNMDITGRTPVLHAVDSHNIDSLRIILDAGGSPNPEYPEGLLRSSPLTAAGFAGMPTLLKLLLERYAEPNACNPEGLTALHSVARTHNTDCALLLLEHSANLNAVSRSGQTPLTTAIKYNNHPVLRLFVDRCYNYMTSTTFSGPKILPVVAEFADVDTINMLTAVHPLKAAYDLSPKSVTMSRALLEQRRDYDEKLADAFDTLVATAVAEIEETKSIDSLLESGFFLSARSSFHSELSEAASSLSSLDNSFTTRNDIGTEQWESIGERFYSPASPSSGWLFESPTSPLSPVVQQPEGRIVEI